MGNCCSRLPDQEIEAPKRHIPPEMIEQILLNLPIKSLLRFSCASTSWKSTITSPQFVAKRDCGRKMVIINDNPLYFDVRNAFCSPLSTSTISDHPVGNAKHSMLVCPFRGPVQLEAYCDQLWCVVVKKSLYLWNPFTGACKKLPDGPPPQTKMRQGYDDVDDVDYVAYGLGYDAVDDDYKLLKIWSCSIFRGLFNKTFLFSLKKGFWRQIDGEFPRYFPNSNGLFVNGAMNWMVTMDSVRGYISDLVTFDFSTEKYRLLKQPMYSPIVDLYSDVVDVVVLRTKLCVFVSYRRSYEDTAFVLWAMEDYGVVESWTKLYEIRYDSLPPTVSEFRGGMWFTMWPLYLYEDGRVVVLASRAYKKWDIIVYKDMDVVAHSKIVPPSRSKDFFLGAGYPDRRVRGGFVYGETFASPIKLPTLGQ